MRIAHTGILASEEARRKISIAKKGKPLSTQAKENIRLGALKRPPVSQETRTKLSASMAGRMKTFIITSPDGTEYVVHGIQKFCEEHQLDAATLINVAQGKRSHHKRWKARYFDTNTA